MAVKDKTIDKSTLRIDPTTLLPNHHQLYLDLEAYSERSVDETGAVILLEIIDHDVLRKFFLAYGASATDQLVCSIAEKIKSILRPTSTIYCVGVGRFALVTFREDLDLEYFLNELRAILNSPYELENFSMLIHVAIGCLPMALALVSPRDALRKVSIAIATNDVPKKAYSTYVVSNDKRVLKTGELLRSIPTAIEEDQFRLVYQPKIDLFGCVKGVEALIRWAHPVYGEVAPGEFISATESTDLIIHITQWVASKTVSTARLLMDHGKATRVSFNVSSKNLDDPEFASFLKLLVDSHSVPARLIEVECTEYSLISSAQAIKTIETLKQMGFLISLDDFGSGYSNLSSLLLLPIDSIKIDKSLTTNALTDQRAAILIRGVVGMTKGLGFKVIVEGVEEEGTAALAFEMGVDEIQGFAIQ